MCCPLWDEPATQEVPTGLEHYSTGRTPFWGWVWELGWRLSPQCLGACWHGQVKRQALKARHALVCCPACPACLLPPIFAFFLTIYWGVLPLMQPQGTYHTITRLVPALLAVKGLLQWRWGQKADKNLKAALFNYSPPARVMLKDGSFLPPCHAVGPHLGEPLSSFGR